MTAATAQTLTGLRQLLFSACVYLTTFFSHRQYLRRYRRAVGGNVQTTDDAVVRSTLWRDLQQMTRIALPSLDSKEGVGTFVFVVLFFARSALRVASSNHDGDVLDALQQTGPDRGLAIRKALVAFGTVEMLFASVSGAIEHLRHWLITSYRGRLTEYFHRRLFDKLIFYHTNVLDERVENAEVFVTSFCAEFAEHFAELPYYFVLPLVEAAAALFTIIRRHGKRSASFMVAVVAVSLFGMRKFTPRFGKIHAGILKREEDFKRMHTEAKLFAEQIALHGGAGFTRDRLNAEFGQLTVALNHMSLAKGHFELLEQSLESLWALGAYVVTVISSQSTRVGPNTALSAIVVELRLVNNFNKFMRDFVVNFKEMSHLSEFTTALADFERTLDDIAVGHFHRSRPVASESIDSVDNAADDSASPIERTRSYSLLLSMVNPERAVCTRARSSDRLEEADAAHLELPLVQFNTVDVTNPKNALLVSRLNVTFRRHQHWAIVGDNARGKTSILRLIAGLWGPAAGTISLDDQTSFFFLPQQAYLLSSATLVEQVCFPTVPTYVEAAMPLSSPATTAASPRRPRSVVVDMELLRDALQAATALSIVESLGGWGAPRIGFEEHRVDRSLDWSTLSGGEKQKIAAARLVYHAALATRQQREVVALLDEATSQMDAESEPALYINLLARGLQLVSVTHRPALLRFHTHALHLGHTPDTWRLEELKSI